MANDRTSLLRRLAAAGWRIAHGTHAKCFPPNGGQMVVISSSGTENNGRGMRNTLARIKRICPLPES